MRQGVAAQEENRSRWFAITVAIVAPILFFSGLFLIRSKYRSYRLPTAAMEPTLSVGDYFITRRVSDVGRGDVITFRYPIQPDTTFVKRVVAMPGETILIRDKRVFIDGQELAEPYVVHEDPQVYPLQPALPEPYRSRDQFGPFTVPAGHYFMMGDNRDKSSDSRYWGALPRRMIEGRVVFVYGRKGIRRF